MPCEIESSATAVPTSSPRCLFRHDPYGWDCLSREYRTLCGSPKSPVGATCDEDFPSSANGLASERSVSCDSADSAAPTVAQDFEMAAPVTPRRYVVQFAYHCEYILSQWPLRVGMLVAVDGDRGMDVAIVTNEELCRTTPIARPSRDALGLRRCLGIATKQQIRDRTDADWLAHLIDWRLRVHWDQRLKVEQEILGVEVQADKHFCVVYYRSIGRAGDLYRKEVVPSLFAEFNCRFWFQNVIRLSAPSGDSFPAGCETVKRRPPCDAFILSQQSTSTVSATITDISQV